MEKLYTCECGYQTTNKQSYCAHCGHCEIKNPGAREKHRYIDDVGFSGWNKGLSKVSDKRVEKISSSLKGMSHKHTEESKRKISDSMKIAHREGRAGNWQDSIKIYNESYPEKFFTQCIINEFDNKNFVREYRIHQYRIDFAWLDEKLAIEIDGSQHERFDSIKESDKRKDLKLRSLGWKILRIKWIDLFNNPKKYIKMANDFINTGNLV